MEVHVELKTDSKMFCACKNELGLERVPNSNICPICTGQPGALPVANEKAIEFVIRAGLALNCQIAKISKFDRKNYFYPDLPKGYQISQYDQPLCEKGYLEIGGKKIGITRIHLEEDTGKLIHQKGTDFSLVDFNRSGVPLMELVTEPDIESAEEAKKFCEDLQQILRYIEISDADMEKGQMRCEANISIRKESEKTFGTKVEVKNLNSFKSVEKAIDFEMKRQEEDLEEGKKVVQETRGWDESKMMTFSQREKESAHDYRYFPEPDLPPLELDVQYVDKIKAELPELPAQKIERFQKEYNLAEKDGEVLVRDKDLAQFFENAVSEACELYSSLTESKKIISREKKNSCNESKKIDLVRDKNDSKIVKLTANYIISELKKYLDEKHKITDLKLTPENFGELMSIVATGKINSSAAQTVLAEMVKTGGDPSHIIAEKNLGQIEDDLEIEKIVKKVISNNPGPVADYKSGKVAALQFLLGLVMKESKGKVEPKKAMEIIKKNLK
ncbi:MAG: aspartyl/glutamyl-tRNA amidotransferase subunit B, aspartyl-tRNA(Asn)/glutamyl-tRNA (Gln) amidotransferase subunit B [Candidatus Moranbacteria bacterium GW2011_GWC1_45_18]|nr:MAG: Aspartyl/glutamyl-tRNA(Asn/Gln) amidotransferase subunit B [Candidatus Moranbacteria bacterium GW2011_GWC2_40_12]KKT31338.1 MAG: Aspartyl/glutamyl-tRNA(Asn/Gln) amidotransferase subunit B [Candidatus Moranbacteria bacterium GW2011_GWF2_44_10]KKT99552.1 MAG: aspartyl/glutamyl-tRNA amidotransferase subunit B, aspartyl-tRNA(Asn)/glutamyl-tRNA (Gln) amidotransferase subunit B [Candidatus Moranbacteria bacterium GW2011_GWC1_45_18]